MKVYYCDLCHNVLNSKKITLSIIKEDNIDGNDCYVSSQKYNYNKEVYEVCESCLKTLREAFRHKRENVDKLTDEMDNMYNC